jgi:transcriptional regulator GlxA family with amidase domain
MSKQDNQFDPCRVINTSSGEDRALRFEIFVSAGFNAFEVAAITEALTLANKVAMQTLFEWRFVSDKPGLVSGANGILTRAEPAIDNHNLPDVMLVVGGANAFSLGWIERARQLQRKALSVVLLSDAATAYICNTNTPSGNVTTHWSDAAQLHETGYYPNLTGALSEISDGIITAAGSGATAELVIGLISARLSAPQVAELSNRLLLPHIRKSDADQPKDIAGNPSLFDHRVTTIIKMMEASLSEPVKITELTQSVGISSRQLERVFRDVFGQSPARFYKQLRTKRARSMIDETLLPLIDIAIATGFGSTGTLSQAIKDEYGITPSKMRVRREVDLLKFA